MTTKRSTPEAGFSAEEKAAMKQAAAERRRTAAGKNGEQDVLEAIAAMDDFDRPIAEGFHALVRRIAPQLTCRTWYGFPAYALDEKGKQLLVYYQYAAKFKARYGTIAFTDAARLDEGHAWPTSWAVDAWDDEVAATIEQLVLRALG